MNLDNVILGTGSYFSVKSGNTVSISGDGGNAWGYYGPAYKKMAPGLETLVSYSRKYHNLMQLRETASNIKEFMLYKTSIENQYIKEYYETRLKDLDVVDFLNMLHDNYGDDIILLSNEHFIDFCHRRLLADYIELETGIYIPEVFVNNEGNVKKINPKRYKNRLKEFMK